MDQKFSFEEDQAFQDLSEGSLGGTNFLVSAVLLLRKQKKELLAENLKLKERLEQIENQNAAFIDINASRLLEQGH